MNADFDAHGVNSTDKVVANALRHAGRVVKNSGTISVASRYISDLGLKKEVEKARNGGLTLVLEDATEMMRSQLEYLKGEVAKGGLVCQATVHEKPCEHPTRTQQMDHDKRIALVKAVCGPRVKMLSGSWDSAIRNSRVVGCNSLDPFASYHSAEVARDYWKEMGAGMRRMHIEDIKKSFGMFHGRPYVGKEADRVVAEANKVKLTDEGVGKVFEAAKKFYDAYNRAVDSVPPEKRKEVIGAVRNSITG